MKNPKVTEEWIKEKANKLLKKTSQYMTEPEEDYFKVYFKDFIRSIIKKVSITVDPYIKSGK